MIFFRVFSEQADEEKQQTKCVRFSASPVRTHELSSIGISSHLVTSQQHCSDDDWVSESERESVATGDNGVHCLWSLLG